MRFHTAPLFALPLLLACVGDVGEGKVAAEVTAPTAVEKAEPATGQRLTIDQSQSTLKALGAKVTATHPIAFKQWSGSVTVDGSTVTDVAFTVQMASLEADHPKLTGHLKNEDFFFVEKFPTATFDAVEIAKGASQAGMSHTVTGDLTIRGQTKRVTFPAKIEVGGEIVTASTEFTIDRQDFGVAYPGRPDDLVQDSVVLTIGFVAPRGTGNG